jgi:hypothetical protein
VATFTSSSADRIRATYGKWQQHGCLDNFRQRRCSCEAPGAISNLRIISQLALPPGRYQLRVALAAASRNTGTVQYDLEVPDFTKAPLSLSSLALASARATLAPTVVEKHVDDRLPDPTTLREFSADDELGLYVEAYDNQTAPMHKVNIISSVRDADGLWSSATIRSGRAWSSKTSAVCRRESR